MTVHATRFSLLDISLADIDTVEITDGEVAVELGRHLGTSRVTYTEELPCHSEVKDPYLIRVREKVAELFVAIRDAVNNRSVETGELPCATCTGACCREWDVFLNVEDVERLGVAGLEAYVDDLPVVDPNGHIARMRKIKAVNPGTGEKEKGCIALGKDGLCTIYDARPTICREFSAWNCDQKEEWVDVPKKRRLKVIA